MNRALFLILSIFSFHAVSGELTKMNGDWLLANESKIEMMLKSQDDIEVMPIINTLGSIWINRDGALGSEVSPYIAQSLIHKPTNMLAWFGAHPDSLDAWLKNLESNLLTNYNGSAEYTDFLNNLKSGLVLSMAKYEGKDKQMATDIGRIVAATEIREID
jgi:hypothetical protein